MARPIDFAALRHLAPQLAGHELRLGALAIDLRDEIDCGAGVGAVAARALGEAVADHAQRFSAAWQPQLAALVYRVSWRAPVLDSYFPLLASLDAPERERFRRRSEAVAALTTFDLRVYSERGALPPEQIPADIAYLVAGQLVEVFFYRPDILDRLLQTLRRFWLYTTPAVYAAAGGVAGGCYSPQHDCVQLLLARLYEPFYTPSPGGAPLLHELGHMLDFFSPNGAAPQSSGLLPGMRPSDGAIYTPEARERFLAGKRIEIQRHADALAGLGTPFPIGHPYVLQNNSEFVAGYLEMFFRNPNFFAAQNPTLYAGFAELLRQDPRRFWPEDFPVYIEDNQQAYRAGVQHRFPMGLTLPRS